MGKLTDAIKGLVIANAVFYAITFFVPDMQGKMFEWLALYFPKNEHFRIWQFLTSIFMHGGFMHILFNMYALWAFGSPLEQMWGRNRFLFFYFAAGLGAGIIYIGVNYFQFNAIYNELLEVISEAEIQTILASGKYDTAILSDISVKRISEFFNIYSSPAIGASGAVYGILVAFGVSFPNAKLSLIFFPVPIAAKYFIPLLIGLDLFSGVTGFSIFGGGIAHFAHVGGALIGFLIMWYWKKNNHLPTGRW